MELDAQGHNFPRFNRYFVLSVAYSSPGVSLQDNILNIPYLDDFLAAVGNCAFRYLALGQITRTGETYKVSVTELGVYILDSFDFNGDQDLGYWNAKTNDVSRTSIGGTPADTPVGNASFRAWRERNARGTDYTNFSDILSRPVSLAFPATQAELTP